MNKTKIEWCDSTWNPVTGCLHKCPYCYARRIAHRFSSDAELLKKGAQYCGMCKDGLYEIDERTGYAAQQGPYPFGFEPTLHRYRLLEPAQKTKGQNIFVCSMADLFGEWVPDEWIEEVFNACEAAPQNNYLFLTKNPHRYWDMMICEDFPDNENYWFGNTITKQSDFTWAWAQNHFYSIEPIMEPVDMLEVFDNDSGMRYVDCVKWVIIGAETGNRKGKTLPQPEWIVKIAEACKDNNVPVFMKDSIIPIIGERNMLREFPEGLQKSIA